VREKERREKLLELDGIGKTEAKRVGRRSWIRRCDRRRSTVRQYVDDASSATNWMTAMGRQRGPTRGLQDWYEDRGM